MRKVVYIICLVAFLGCDSENAWDCFQKSGKIIDQEFNVGSAYKTIQIWERVQLILTKGETERVVVQTGENLMNEIQVKLEDSILKVSDRNSCNYTREYGITKVFVTTTKNILKIRNSSGLTVEGRGELRFEELELVSEDPQNTDLYHHDGDFRLDSLNVGRLKIRANGLSNFYLNGRAGFANFRLSDGDSRIEAANLNIEGLFFFHRGTNQMIVNPENSIRGTISSIGDVISKNRPPIVEVEELFSGRLIFE